MKEIIQIFITFFILTSCILKNNDDVTNGGGQSSGDGPVISFIADQRSQVNIPPSEISFTISDPNDALNCATSIVISSSNQALVPDQNITLAGSAPHCTLTLTPLSNILGTSTILITLTDGTSQTTRSFTFTSFNPWSAISSTNAPSARSNHKAVVADDKMVIWGGGNSLNTGGVYNSSTDTWTSSSLVNAPSGRFWNEMVSDDDFVYVIGGKTDTQGQGLTSCSKYDPDTDSWSSMASFPDKRYLTSSVWTGTHIIVWGGGVTDNLGDEIFVNSGYKYDPLQNTWTPISSIGAPSARRNHSSAWVDGKMIVWGGQIGCLIANSGSYGVCGNASNGGAYDPNTDTWITINSADLSTYFPDPPSWTDYYHLVWSSGLSAWHGVNKLTSSGSIITSTYTMPSQRVNHTTIWTDQKLIIWGGTLSDGTNTSTGFIFEL